MLEIEQTADPILAEVLDFLQFLKAKQMQQAMEEQEDLADARLALQQVKQEGTVSWDEIKAELCHLPMSDISPRPLAGHSIQNPKSKI